MAVVDARDALGVGVKVHGWRPDGGPRRALYWMRMFILWGLMKVNDPRHEVTWQTQRVLTTRLDDHHSGAGTGSFTTSILLRGPARQIV